MNEEIKRKAIKRRKRWNAKKKITVSIVSILAIITILVSTILVGYFYVKDKIYTESKPPNSKTDETVQYTEVPGVTNILLIGTDGRTLSEPSRADSIIIATLDNNNNKIKLTSLFRDTLVNIPEYGESKINGAFLQGGAELLMETVQQTYDIKIDKYIIINFWGFEAVIDQIGGLEVDVKDYQLEELNKYIGESTGGNDSPVTETGLQLLNGKQALSYARIRYNVGDEYERTERQREVIFKVVEKLKVTKPSKYLGIMNKMLDFISTNIDPMEALNMAYTIYKFPKLETEQLQMPITELAESRLYKDLGWVFLMDKEQNAKILKKFIFEDKLTDPEQYDYNSLSEKLAAYAADESSYNSIYGINPQEYETVDENSQYIPEKQITMPIIEETPQMNEQPVKEEEIKEEEIKEEKPVEQQPPVKEETPTNEEKPLQQQENTTNGSSLQEGTATEKTNP